MSLKRLLRLYPDRDGRATLPLSRPGRSGYFASIPTGTVRLLSSSPTGTVGLLSLPVGPLVAALVHASVGVWVLSLAARGRTAGRLGGGTASSPPMAARRGGLTPRFRSLVLVRNRITFERHVATSLLKLARRPSGTGGSPRLDCRSGQAAICSLPPIARGQIVGTCARRSRRRLCLRFLL